MRKLMLAQGCGNWKVYIVRSMRTVFRPHGCRSVGSVHIFTRPRPRRLWGVGARAPGRAAAVRDSLQSNRCQSGGALVPTRILRFFGCQRLRDSLYEPYLQRMREDYMILEACTRIQINGVDQFPSFELPHPN